MLFLNLRSGIPQFRFLEDSVSKCYSTAVIIANVEIFDRIMFYISGLIIGFGATPMYTLGLTYLDENVKKHHSSTYHGQTIMKNKTFFHVV